MLLYFISDDSWSSQDSPSLDLFNWPSGGAGSLISQYVPGITGWRTADVLSWLNSEYSNGRKTFSVKWEVAWGSNVAERIVSPGNWRTDRAPYIEVVYQFAPATNPDLAISRGDITFNPMTPLPSDPVQITATVRNNGGSAANNVLVRFFDGSPWSGTQIGSDYYIPSIPGGGGTAVASVNWPAPPVGRPLGLHNIYVQVDPNRAIPFIHEGNKTAFRPFWQLQNYTYYSENFVADVDHWTYDQQTTLTVSKELPLVGGCVETKVQLDRDGQVTTSLHLSMDARNDDGSVFLKRRIPIQPGTGPTINLSFWMNSPGSSQTLLWFIGDYEPEVESDFTADGPTSPGWNKYSFQRTLPGTSDASEAWVAFGATIGFEGPPYDGFVDDIVITVA